jgi:hypothetical protein
LEFFLNGRGYFKDLIVIGRIINDLKGTEYEDVGLSNISLRRRSLLHGVN